MGAAPGWRGVVSALFHALAFAFRSLTVSREPGEAVGVKLVLDGKALEKAARVAFEGAGEVGAEPDLASWQSFAAMLSELAARLNYQQPWPPARPPLTILGVPTYDAGTTTLTVAFSEAVDPTSVVGAFALQLPIYVTTVTVDEDTPSLVHLVLSGTGSANPGTQGLTISGVSALSGAVLEPDPTETSWMLP